MLGISFPWDSERHPRPGTDQWFEVGLVHKESGRQGPLIRAQYQPVSNVLWVFDVIRHTGDPIDEHTIYDWTHGTLTEIDEPEGAP